MPDYPSRRISGHRLDNVIDNFLRSKSPGGGHNCHWFRISQIRRDLSDYCQETCGFRLRPVPSASTVKNSLLRLLQQRKVVGKLGWGGAAYFTQIDAYREAAGLSRGPEPRIAPNWQVRRAQNNFNNRVHQAFLNNDPFPDPYEGNPSTPSTRSTGTNGGRSNRSTPYRGPIDPEPLEVTTYVRRRSDRRECTSTVRTVICFITGRNWSEIQARLGTGFYIGERELRSLLCRTLGADLENLLQEGDYCERTLEDQFLREAT